MWYPSKRGAAAAEAVAAGKKGHPSHAHGIAGGADPELGGGSPALSPGGGAGGRTHSGSVPSPTQVQQQLQAGAAVAAPEPDESVVVTVPHSLPHGLVGRGPLASAANER